jgi:pimeloyl-ACP methyl ester carboxylesterase
MTTYALVSGAWHGGWCWQSVARRLQVYHHVVYPLTLTGLGERVHLARPDIDLETHIADVINVLDYEDLADVVLVGHSYAGAVITGVADRRPERLAQLVYLDAGPLGDGEAFLDFYPPDSRDQIQQ